MNARCVGRTLTSGPVLWTIRTRTKILALTENNASNVTALHALRIAGPLLMSGSFAPGRSNVDISIMNRRNLEHEVKCRT